VVLKKTQKSKRRFSETQSTNTQRRSKERPEFKVKPRDEEKSRGDQSPSKSNAAKKAIQKQFPKGNNKVQVVEK
jgi:hypothetical protein